MFASQTIFKSVLKLCLLAGFLSLKNVKKSNILPLNRLYMLGLFIFFITQVVLQLIVFLFKYNQDDGSGVVCVFASMSNSALIIAFYLIRFTKVADNFVEITNIVEIILKDNIPDEFLKDMERHSNKVNKLINLYMKSVYILLFTEVLFKALSYVKIIDLVTIHSVLIYVFPWPVDEYTFWPSLAFEAFSLGLMILVQQANHYYIMTMIILQTICFRHLRVNLAYAISLKYDLPERSSLNQLHLLKPLFNGHLDRSFHPKIRSPTEHRLLSWIELHTHLLSVCKEFVSIFTPLLVTYFVVLFTSLVSGVFSITQNHYYFGIAEEMLLGLYFIGIIFNLLLLSVVGSNLIYESTRVFEDAFHMPWYECSPQVQSSLLIISTVSHRPMSVAAFGSKAFNVSLHKFIWVLRSMVSIYVGLAQVKHLAGTESGTDNL